jgi:3-oxoadipate enol-lactonase
MIVRTAFGDVGCDVTGSGEALLLLHGFPHDRTLWAPQLAAAPAGLRVIAPDLPGFGESAPLADASFETWADWVAALLDTLEVGRAVVGGLSMGGYLAFAVWRRHAARVRGLVLADTRPGADTDEARANRRAMQSLARAEGAGAIAEKMLPGMVGKTTRETRPEVVETLRTMMGRAAIPALTDALDAMIEREDSTPTLGTITVPTLVMCGEEDVLTPVADSRAMHAAIPGSRLALIPGAGHASNLEAPAVFNGLLYDFTKATIRGPTS